MTQMQNQWVYAGAYNQGGYNGVASLTAADFLCQGKARHSAYNTISAGMPDRGIEVNLPVVYSFGAPVARSRNGVAHAATPSSGVAMTLTSATVTFDMPRCITLYSASNNESAHSVTVTGTDFYGKLQTETISGPNSSSIVTIAVGKKAFATVTQVMPNATFTGNIEVGYSGRIGLPFRLLNEFQISSLIGGNSISVNGPEALQATIGAQSTGETRYVTAPISGVISALYANSNASNTTTANVITVSNNTEVSFPAVMGTLTFGTAYTAGTVVTGALNANNCAVAAGDVIKIVNAGGGTGTGPVDIMLVIEAINLVVGDITNPATSTTGDTRGTIDIGRAGNSSTNLAVQMFPDRSASPLGFGVKPA